MLTLEVIARASFWRTEYVPSALPTGFGYSASGLGDLTPNLDSVEEILHNRPYHLQTNSVGLRNIAELDTDPSTFRILALGDSFTYGYYVHNEETWPARLEELLNQHLQTRIQVLNAGVPGYTIVDQLEYLLDKGLKTEPNLVVIGFYTNDIFDFYPQIRQYFARSVLLKQDTPSVTAPVNPLITFLRQNSAIYRVLSRLRADAQVQAEVNRITPTIPGLDQLYRDMVFYNPDKPEYVEEWSEYDEHFREVVSHLSGRGIPVVLMAFPDLAQLPVDSGLPDRPQRFLAQLTADTGTPYLDLLPVYREQGEIQSLYLMYYNSNTQVDPTAPDAFVRSMWGDGHPSPYGHLVAARALANLLMERSLVPG
ncbi:MAG: SGNH/GDSL hydrolase family protein [Anaerolineae bacterium]